MAETEAGPSDRVDPPEPHLTDVQPVPSTRCGDEKIMDPRAVALLFLVFLLLLALMYQITQGR